MNLSEIFIRRPVMTTLVMIGILLFGILSYSLLPISPLPNIDYPFVNVTASLPGATPETMASTVAAPLERQFTEIAGLDSSSSTNTTGSTNISLQFSFSRSVEDAAKDVQAAINAAAGELPTGMPKPPTYRKVNPSASPIIYIYMYSDTEPIYTVDEYGEVTVGQPITMIDGVAQIQVYGQKQYAIRAQLDPQALATRGISFEQVKTAIQAANVDLPNGNLSGTYKSSIVQMNGQLNEADAYKSLVVTYQNGEPVRLQDLGNVIDDVLNNKIVNLYTDKKVTNHLGIVLAVQPQPGANTVQIVDDVKKLLPSLRAQVPQSIEMGILYDRSISVRASIDDVKFSLILSIALVVGVIFLFLRDLNATLIPSLALPIAVIGTFAAMYLLGYSLDNLSLMALTLSVGFVIDDAVVVLENIVRYLEMGEAPMEAALKGSKEVSFTILSMTLSLVAVFIPIMFMGGLIGRIFHEFAVTISVAILVSGFVSLSLTPMLCSRFLRSSHQKQGNLLYRITENAFDFLLKGYELTLKPVLKYRLVTVIVSVLILVMTAYLFTIVSKGFIPAEDTGQLYINTKAAQDISFDDMLLHQQKLVEIVRKEPYVESLTSTVGAAGPNASVNSGRIFASLKPRPPREINSIKIVEVLNKKLRKAGIVGITAFPRSPTAIPVGSLQSNSQYQFSLKSLDLQALRKYTPIMLEKVKTIPGLDRVDSDLQLSTPQIEVQVDNQKAATFGITASQVQKTLGDAYGSSQISTMYTPNNEFYVILEVKPEYQSDPNALSLLYVQNSAGASVPLSAIAKLTQDASPLTVNHLGQLPAATISFDIASDASGNPLASLSEVTEKIKQFSADTLRGTPVTADFEGQAKAFAQSFNGLGLLLLISIVVIYLILGILYEDFLHPLTILSGLPSAGFGALLTLLIFNVELDLYSFIGIILLVGIVKKNGIMMVDFAIEKRRSSGVSPMDAIYEACLVRFRPIMMTTMAALIGTLPIALGSGSGSEARRPLGIAVVGGLVFSQFLTLYITPVFYTYVESWRGGFGKPKFPRIFSKLRAKHSS